MNLREKAHTSEEVYSTIGCLVNLIIIGLLAWFGLSTIYDALSGSHALALAQSASRQLGHWILKLLTF